ncbi:BON domain-containing protein [Dyadobacter sp. BHUBP1]|uniref:BON domain-containing protein n=1 Tax=Dyadobacter sp. BHUBP1 TaxID=3424178 RepID=UPI003D33C76F
MTTCIPDLAIAEQISSILHRDVRINESDIQVSVHDGWVFLEGHVDFETDRQLVESRIEHVTGVCRITNNLTYPHRRNH